MDKQFLIVRVLIISYLAAYFILGIFLTGKVVPAALVLFLVLVLWFLLYKFRRKELTNRELVTKMHADLKGMLEGTKERIAQEEASKRTAAEREVQARVERERRRTSRPSRDPAVSKYAEMIETRVRESEQAKRRSEGQ